MTRKTFTTLLMVSWICMFAAVLVSFFGNLSAWAAFIITLILALNTRSLFDEEWTKKLATPLWIQLAVMLMANILSVIAAIANLTLIGAVIGIPLIIFVCILNIGVGIWQLLLWNQLKDLK